MELRQTALLQRPNDPKLQRGVAVSYWAVASSELVAGQAAANPGNAQARRELLGASWLLASSFQDLQSRQKKSLEEVVPLWQNALQTGTHLLNADPGNDLVETDVTLISFGLASLLDDLHQPAAALEVLGPAIARQRIRYQSNPDSRSAGSHLALLELESADCYLGPKNLTAALKSVHAGTSIINALLSADPGSIEFQFDRIEAFRSAAKIAALAGDDQGARSAFRQGLEAAAKLPLSPSRYGHSALVAEMKSAS